MNEPSVRNSADSDSSATPASSLSAQRTQSLAGTSFEILCKRTTPAGLPHGMQWNPHNGAREMQRRQARLAKQEIADARRRAREAGFDLETGDEPERA